MLTPAPARRPLAEFGNADLYFADCGATRRTGCRLGGVVLAPAMQPGYTGGQETPMMRSKLPSVTGGVLLAVFISSALAAENQPPASPEVAAAMQPYLDGYKLA